MSVWRTLIEVIDADVDDQMSRRGFGLWLPRKNWSLLLLPFVLLLIPAAFMRGDARLFYLIGPGVVLIALFGLWFWRFAIMQDAKMKKLLAEDEGKTVG